jgi:hypothetical protein
VNALFADKKKNYFCSSCGCKVIPRQGEHNIYHFAHPKGTECLDSWNYDMSEWHSSWQNQFPEEMQEVVLTNNNEKHRADVLIENKKLVIEFQHSNLSSEEFRERNEFYNSCGYDVIWLFDVSERNIDCYKFSHQYKWKWGTTTLSGFYPPCEKKITVFFQFDNAPFDNDFEEGVIEKYSWCPLGTERISIFRTEERISYSPYEFVCFLKKDINDVVRKEQISDYLLPQDSIYGIEFDMVMVNKANRSDDETINIVKSAIDSTAHLIYCYGNPEIIKKSEENDIFCRYRIKVWMINEIHLLSSQCIEQITAALKSGSKEIIAAEKYSFFGRSIPEIMKNQNIKGAGVINLRTGKDFYVSNSDYFKRENIYVVKGKPKLDYGNKYSDQYWEIYGAFKPEWMVKFSY